MTVEIVEVGTCKRNLVVEVPADEVEAEIQKLAKNYAARVRIPGFRPGKVPLGIIRQRYESELRNDAAQDLISHYMKGAIEEHQLHPLDRPVVEALESEPGNPMKFTVSFEVLPALEVRDYSGVPVTVPAPRVEESDVDAALEALRQEHAESVP